SFIDGDHECGCPVEIAIHVVVGGDDNSTYGKYIDDNVDVEEDADIQTQQLY
ncbi:hypothetical protein Bpfe_010935, partial [Biomphalaria pfeifferi]